MEMIFLSAAMRHAPDPPASPLEPATVPYHPLVATSQAHISLWFYLAAFNTRNTFFEMFSCLGSLALALPFPDTPSSPFQTLSARCLIRPQSLFPSSWAILPTPMARVTPLGFAWHLSPITPSPVLRPS